MGITPKEESMPVEFDELPYEVQCAFELACLLPFKIAGFSGEPIGKDYTNFDILKRQYNVKDENLLLHFVMVCEHAIIKEERFKLKEQRALEEAKKGD